MEEVEKYVEAIEEGKIVRVSEAYARREGLAIIRKPRMMQLKDTVNTITEQKARGMHREERFNPKDVRRPLNWRKDQVLTELVENFHWQIAMERKKRGLSRKQFGQMIGEKEDSIKMLEFGMLPSNDFVLINKVQDAFGINLRKDGKNYNRPPKDINQSTPVSTVKGFSKTPPPFIPSHKEEVNADGESEEAIDIESMPDEE